MVYTVYRNKTHGLRGVIMVSVMLIGSNGNGNGKMLWNKGNEMKSE